MPAPARRLHDFGTTVFSEFSALALEHRAINLGQGFPDFDGPEEIREAAVRAIRGGLNQYAVGSGAAALRAAIAEHSQRFYRTTVDPNTMVTVTSGATEAIFDTVIALVDPGDEVVLFEPFYDSYAANVAMAGAIARFVPLRAPDQSHPGWWFERDELASAFSDRTKLIVVNTPHNPTGKVFSKAELLFIAELCERHDAWVLSDEVYEHIVFEPARHLSLSTLPELATRTVTVSSSGKSFSLTGWKLGWVIAPPALRAAVQSAHQFVTFASAAPLQAAIAEALRLPDSYFQQLALSYRGKRDRLLGGLNAAGLKAHAPEGSYFIMADIGGWGFDDDFEFCRFLTRKVGVAAIPPSAFYGSAHREAGARMARFAFCKTEAVLDEAVSRLKAHASAAGR